ncbi:MAG: hypothetical protein PHN78_08480 [Dehalococcoidales bacterium]|nr:hypothetical protein [Dehalococcoidales bacterium]
MLISRGNLKIGELPSFSLPVITTCPGKTPFCERYCFGLKGNFNLQNVKDANDRRLEATFRADFVDTIVNEIVKSKAPAFRIHVVGDFFLPEYVEKWISIANILDHVIFFGSTRAWRCNFLIESIKRFRDLRNVYVKASTDLTDTIHPCAGWNIWSVEGEGLACPHDEGKVANCFVCKRCWTNKNVDVKFKLRWGDVGEYMTPPMFSKN